MAVATITGFVTAVWAEAACAQGPRLIPLTRPDAVEWPIIGHC
jgi:hypothetical protein